MLEARRPLIGPSEIDDQGRQIGGIIDPEVLWDCTTCGACVEQCPVDIEHVDHIVDMRRYQVMIESEFPSELGGLFRNLENKGNPWGQNQKDRLAWAKDLDFEVPVITDTIDPDHEYLFWVGCAGAFDDRAKKTTRAVAELMHMAAVGFAVLGTGETCTGDPARRAGNEFLFQMLAQATVETLNEAFGDRTTRKIVVTCPHCFNTLSNEYGDLGGKYEVIHHTQLLNRLVRDRRLIVKKDPAEKKKDVTYHDPCYLGRHNKVYAPPRELIEASGVTLKEMPRNSARSMCCGAGGARMWMEEKIGKRINLERTDEAPGHRGGADRHRLPVLQGDAHRRPHRAAGPDGPDPGYRGRRGRRRRADAAGRRQGRVVSTVRDRTAGVVPGFGSVDLAGRAVQRGAQLLLLAGAEPREELAFRVGDALFQFGKQLAAGRRRGQPAHPSIGRVDRPLEHAVLDEIVEHVGEYRPVDAQMRRQRRLGRRFVVRDGGQDLEPAGTVRQALERT